MKYIFFYLFFLIQSSLVQAAEIKFHPDFLFGIANAPGHVEDQLDDIWMDFAQRGGIKAFKNEVEPEKRLEFWSKPEIEIDLAQELGSEIFRLGVDWGRIHTGPGQLNQEALNRYRDILQQIKSKKMKVMLTLFHFSMPKWVQEQGGWKNKKTIDHFNEFSLNVIQELHPLVDFWITFNEPQIFSTMSYALGIFPPGEKGPWWSLLNLGFLKGEAVEALDHMALSHKEIFLKAHAQYPGIQIGIAQHMGFHTSKTLLGKVLSYFSGDFMNWYFPDLIKGHVDYFGFNYYGAEWVGWTGVNIERDEEYSEAGRAIYPTGLYLLSHEIKKRYGDLPQFITENGVSDATDWLRPSYLIEHLAAIHQLQQEKVKIMGYIFWTLTDNMEWSDGYCPKFGLVEVLRSENHKRRKRGCFDLYQKIIQTKTITPQMRSKAWKLVETHFGQERPFCRSSDGVTGLDKPVMRRVVEKDWRFKKP